MSAAKRIRRRPHVKSLSCRKVWHCHHIKVCEIGKRPPVAFKILSIVSSPVFVVGDAGAAPSLSIVVRCVVVASVVNYRDQALTLPSRAVLLRDFDREALLRDFDRER